MKQLLNKNLLFTSLDISSHHILNNIVFSDKLKGNLKSRSTANFGKVYQYKGVDYEENDYNNTPDLIKQIGEEAVKALKEELNIGMNINNCLVNIYSNGKQKMGYHSDDVEQLVDGTGVLIVSVGSARILAFRKKGEIETADEFVLTNGSIFYMDAKCQEEYKHAILASTDDTPRISLTFRQLK